MPSKPKKSRQPVGRKEASTTEHSMDEAFEHAFAVIDSAYTSALISGISPECLLATLSYGFLNTAARGRERLAEFETWLSSPELVWKPILSEVLSFVENFDGEVECEEELRELTYLQEECKIKHLKLSEIEERQHNKKAFSLFSWLITALQNQGHEALFIECALFIEWIKVSAVVRDYDKLNYMIIRKNVPGTAECWDSLL